MNEDTPALSPEGWVRLKPLLAQAFELPAEALPGFLDQLEAEDSDLRDEVARLLRACQHGTRSLDFLESPAAEFMAPLLNEVARDPSLGRDSGLAIGPYVLERHLGAGGMGVVYLARDPRLDRKVALKLLPAWLPTDDVASRRLAQEARAASQLDHPNIQTVYEIDATPDGRPYIAMAYYDGETLTERIARGPLQIDAALDLTRQLADGLAAAHAHGIVHRDVKPGNLIVTPEGVAKILDFGAAQVIGQGLGRPGGVLGTVAYMSPEQTRRADVDVRSDVWSLGVVIYEMLTGRRPFPGEDAETVMHAIRSEQPAPVRALRPEVSEALAGIVHRCLEKEPRARFADAASLREALLRSPELSGGTSSPERARPWSRLSGAGVLLGALLVGAVVLWPDAQAGPGPEGAVLSDASSAVRLAVLPLADSGFAPADAYLADGLTEELISRLSVLRSVQVVTLPPGASFEDTNEGLSGIAGELGVRTLLVGEGRREGEGVQLSLELVDAVSLERLWEHEGPAALADLSSVMDAIAERVAMALRVDVRGGDRRLMTSGGTTSQEALTMYYLGRHYLRKLATPGATRQAREYFDSALDKDPTFALAWSGLSGAFHQMAIQGILAPHLAEPRARDAADRALQLDPELAEAHNHRAAVFSWYEWDAERAEQHFRRALELRPSFARAHRFYSVHLRNQGRFPEALALVRRARELEPLSPGNYLQEGLILYMARRYDEALAKYDSLLLVDPRYTATYFYRALAFEQMGRHEQALLALGKTDPDMSQPDPLAIRGYVLARFGRESEAHEALSRLDSLADSLPVSQAKALIHVGLGELDRALDLLEQAVQERAWQTQLLKVEPSFDPLRSKPRFQSLLEELNLLG